MCEKRQADALEKMEEEGLLTKSKEPDWTALLALAEQKGEEENQNQFYMDEAPISVWSRICPKRKE